MNDILKEATDLKGIYQDMDAYQNLREEDRKFFDNLFILLLFNENKVYSNKYLSQRFNIPISTLEKRIRRLNQANLIRRKVENELLDNNKWITSARTIELDPVTFAFMKARTEEDRIQAARQEAFDKNSYIPKETVEKLRKDIVKEEEEVSVPEELEDEAIAEFRRMLESL